MNHDVGLDVSLEENATAWSTARGGSSRGAGGSEPEPLIAALREIVAAGARRAGGLLSDGLASR